ncbi:MAG: HU family DNA-binding protein [Pseudanabaenaceae cyanobacterium bins.68]|nr:HU family DNA-binding protein [Pseudanabaenaceae cyanobacterium bins.68]
MADRNRRDLVRYISEEVDGVSQAVAGACLDAAIAYICQCLSEHQSVIIQDFGKFGVRYRAARRGTNPLNTMPLEIPQTAVSFFHPSAKLKSLVKTGKLPD